MNTTEIDTRNPTLAQIAAAEAMRQRPSTGGPYGVVLSYGDNGWHHTPNSSWDTYQDAAAEALRIGVSLACRVAVVVP